MCQLQLVGEVVYVETEAEEDLVVLHPQWLCSEVIGQLLSHDLLSTARPTGCFSADDFQLLFPDSDVKDLLCLLEALELCTRCDVEGEVEYEFPCLNFIETLHGLWERDDTRLPQGLYGGVRLQCPAGVINQLVHLFPRIQAHLRCDLLENNNGPDCDLYQWYHGTKFCKGSMEALVTLEQKEQVLEVKVRGSEACRAALYYFLEEISDVVSDVLEDACPGIALEKHVLSPNQLKAHKKAPLAYSPKDLLSTQNDRKDSCRLNDSEPAEKLTDLLFCGAAEIGKTITLGIDLHISHMSVHLRRKLSSLLDPPDCMGKDWCLLAVGLGLTEDLPKLDQTHPQSVSRTDGILALWSRETSSNIRSLLLKLRELGRQDAVDAVLMMAPLYHVFPEDQDGGDSEDLQKETTPHSSDNTIASR
ncbi:hypothetical protein CAPTEDRAFT_228788 [Capitella teleta]|uniref:Death domain-containing protein n=1 Tax=Capitella teleta TaxID=283909 RepID=R7TB03_CAPTE|nr:hypothetical protein CAPTEDRAFT_228788 [Capitella teleta]|eukprot:ELT88672.1 hypothetical protein CAPTEDRAFT_228788 [Capitella teleta]